MESVKLEMDGKTTIINICIQEEEIYRFLQDVEEEKRAERLVSALRIGILGLKQMGIGENVDYVEKEFNTLLSRFEKMFASIENSHLAKLSTILREYFSRGGTVENIFDPMRENTPISKLRKELLDEISKIRDVLVKKDAKEEVVNSTPLKGYKFEDTCEEILSEIVSNNMGDELERKTNEVGEINGCFAGDFVISLRNMLNKKIVFETKDVESISQPMIIETMKKAMKNRGANYGIFVIKYREGMPRKIGAFNEFRNTIAVVGLGSKEENTFLPELLHIAYQWARLRLNTEITFEQKAVKTLDEGIKQISEKMEILTQIQRQCTNIEKSSTQIREYSNDLKNNIEEHIRRIQKALLDGEENDRQ